MDGEEPPQPPQPMQLAEPPQPPQPPQPHGRGPKRTIHHSSFVPMPQTQRLDGQPHVDLPADLNLPDFDYTHEDLHDPNVHILVDLHDRYVITAYNDTVFLPNRLVTEAITAVIQSKYQKPWLSWGEMKLEGKDMVDEEKPRDQFWNLFKEKCTWKKEEDSAISKLFDSACSRRLSNMLFDARKKRGPNNAKRPHWIGEGTWPLLCKKWDEPEYKSKCGKAYSNRHSEKATTSTHSGGSVNATTSSFRFKAKHGRPPTILETFDHYHVSNGEPIDSRSRNISTTFKAFTEAFQKEQDSLAPSEKADPITVEKNFNAKYIEIVGGKVKGRILGASSNSSLYHVDSSGSLIDTSRNSYGSTGRSARRQDDPIYTEVEQLRAENANLRARQEDMEKSFENRVNELVQRALQEQQRRPRGDTPQHGPYDHEITPHYEDLVQTSGIRYAMPQLNKRPRIQPPPMHSDHDEHQRFHIHVGDLQTSARPGLNVADFNIPQDEGFLRYMQSPQYLARGGNRSERASGGRLNSSEYYDN